MSDITVNNVLFCYRSGDADSLEVAQYYQAARGLAHLLSLPCDNTTTLSYADYITQIEGPILNELGILGHSFDEDGDKTIYVIILGFNVPYIYADIDGEAFSIPSRLHRIGHAKSNSFPNPTYNRTADFRFFDDVDSNSLFVTGVLNGPDKNFVKQLIDRNANISKDYVVRGNIYCNPYGAVTDAYESTILDFISREIPNTGLTVVSTMAPDLRESQSLEYVYEYEYYSDYDSIDIVYPAVEFFENDSFYWGRGPDSYSISLFLNQSERRVFAYNADNSSASDITEEIDVNNTGKWCNVTMSAISGYACSAGAVSDLSLSEYLDPRAFFESLHHGATIGEAFLFASPTVDSKLVFFGDPMTTVMFSSALPKWQDATYTLTHNNDSIRFIKQLIEYALAYGSRGADTIQAMVDTVTESVDMDEKLEFLKPFNTWNQRRNIDYYKRLYGTPVADWARYVTNTTGLSVDDWITDQNLTVSADFKLVADAVGALISLEHVKPDGQWQYEFQYIHAEETLENIHFEIEVASDCNYLNTQSISSFVSTLGWFYEKEYMEFISLPTEGYPSNLSKRRVRFISPLIDYLTTNEIYYLRWRALDSTGSAITNWNTLADTKLIICEGA